MIASRLALIARLYIGMIFLVAASGKLIQPIDFAGPMQGFLGHVALVNGYGWYASFVRSVVLPHAHVFAILVIAAEATIAVGMLFGIATRLIAVLAIFLLANYACAKGVPIWSPGSEDIADIVLCVIVWAGPGGRAFGVDKALHERFPRMPFW
jgi:uncharacterized membrane protein YphA (DoxX/SURF4 family)